LEKDKEKKLEILFFLFILLWQIVFNFIIFPQRLFLKYPLNVLKFFSKLEPSERFLDFSPFYLFINGFFSIFSKNGYQIIPYLQIFCCTLGLYFFFQWTKKKFSQKIAYLVTFLVSIYPSHLLYLNCLEPEAFLVFTAISGFSFLLLEKSPLLVGTFFAISVLLRPSFLPIALFLFFFTKGKKILYLIPLISSIFILLIYSHWATGYFTLTFMSPGTVFYEGNNPEATGVAAIYPKTIKLWEGEFSGKEADYAHRLYKKVAEFEDGKTKTLKETQFFWFKKTFNYIIDYPFLWLQHYFKKIWFYFSAGEAHDIFSLIMIYNILGILKLYSFAIFSSLAFLAVFFNFKKLEKVIFFSFLLNITILSLFYFSSRQRMTLFSFIIFIIPYGLEVLLKNKIKIIIFLLFYSIFSFIPSEVKNFTKTFQEIQRAGGLEKDTFELIKEKRFSDAAITSSLCIAEAPYLFYGHSTALLPFYKGTVYASALNIKKENSIFNKGLLYFYDGNTKEALTYFEKIKFKKIQKHYYNSDLPIYYYIICLIRENKIEEAKNYLKIAKEKYPAFLSIMTLDYLLNGKNNLTKYYDVLYVNFKLAETSFFLRDFKNSLNYSKKAAEIAPEILYTQEISAVSYAFLGNFQEMAKLLKFIVEKKIIIVFHREWQIITKGLEERYGKDENFIEFLNYMRSLFPKYE